MKTVKAVKAMGGTFAGRCRFEAFSFGSIRIDGVTYEHDVLIDRGQVRKRKKKPSKQFRPKRQVPNQVLFARKSRKYRPHGQKPRHPEEPRRSPKTGHS